MKFRLAVTGIIVPLLVLAVVLAAIEVCYLARVIDRAEITQNALIEVDLIANAIHTLQHEAAAQKADDEAVILGKAQRGVDLLTDGLAALARADLSKSFGKALDPEYDTIRRDFNSATDRLRALMLEIARTTTELGTWHRP